jgi:hypothetical protein
MNTVLNEFDDEYRPGDYLEVLADEADTSLDFDNFFSKDISQVEDAIKSASNLQSVTSMLIALSVYHIIENGLYLEKAKSMSEYFANADGVLNMSRQLAYRYYNSAAAFKKHRARLVSHGFKATKDFSKLIFLEKAVEEHGLDAVSNLPKMTYRDFSEYAQNRKLLDYSAPEIQQVQLDITEQGIMLGDKLVVDVTQVKKIIAEGSEPFLIGVYSQGEKTILTRYLKEYRSKH